MKVYGQLEYAQLHQLSADPTAGKNGLLYWNYTTSQVMVDTGAATIFLVDKNSVQTLQGKSVGDTSDATKTLTWSLAGATTGKACTFSFAHTVNRTITFPDATDTVCYLALAQTLSAKTLASPIYTGSLTTPLTASRAIVTDGSSILAASATTSTELGYVSGVTSAIQTQLNTKDPNRNLVLNSAFDVWQRGTSLVIANNAASYLADRWIVWNGLGVNGVITYSQVSGTVSGSLYGAKLLITTAPTSSQANHCELNYSWDNLSTMQLYGQTVSISFWAKSFGNVNSMLVRIFRNTAEGKCYSNAALSLLTSTTFAITGAMTQYTWNNLALGTAMGLAGNLGLSFDINGVSTGNTYDLNNGYAIEQVKVAAEPTASVYTRMYPQFATELSACQRYYWRVNGGSGNTWLGAGYFDSTTSVFGQVSFPVIQRAVPVCSVNAGTSMIMARPGTSNAGGSGTPTYSGTSLGSTQINITAAAVSTAGYATMWGVQSGGWFEANAEL